MKEKAAKVPARERILQTALHLFYSHGIRATGIDTIIKESGVAKMTFYNHFPSKKDLVIEVIRRGDEVWFSKFHSVVDKIEKPKEKLLGLFDFLDVWFRDPNFRGCAAINTYLESRDPKDEECILTATHKEHIGDWVAQTALEAGYDKRRAKNISRKFLLLMDGAIIRAVIEQSAKPAALAKELAETTLDQ